jgi:hypothetical protein
MYILNRKKKNCLQHIALQNCIDKINMAEEELNQSLEYTPTWIVAVVCSIIVFISLIAERALHRLGKVNQLIFSHFCDLHDPNLWQQT